MKKHLPIFILLGCVAAFVFGVVRLFQLRFEAGDVYPPYSSLRADPLGTMAFYESLEKIPGLSVRRNFSASNVLPEKPDTVYLHLAGNRYEWDWVPKDLFQEIEAFLERGGRLVITYFPENEPDIFHLDDEEQTNSVKSAKSNDKKMTPEKPAKKKKELDQDEYGVQLDDRWGLHTDLRRLSTAEGVYQPAQVVNKTDLPLPRTLEWHSGIVFTNLDPAWRVIYARDTNAVVIERQFGRGSVVIATDSYFVSNEAMARNRHADLLAWLIGANKNVVFDEAHFGIMERSGVAVLMRKYRLQGLIAGLVLLAGLFVWKNSTSLVPPHVEEKRENVIAGKDAASGFVNLLRRNIPRREVLAACFAEWKKSVAQKGKISPTRLQQAEAIFSAENSLPNKDRNPIQTYRKISEVLNSHVRN